MPGSGPQMCQGLCYSLLRLGNSSGLVPTGWPCLGRGRLCGQGPVELHLSCRSSMCERPQALFLRLLLDLHFAQISQILPTGLLPVSQFHGTSVLAQVKPFSQLVSHDLWHQVQGCQPAEYSGKWRALSGEPGFSRSIFSRAEMVASQLSPLPASSLSTPYFPHSLAK